MTGVNIKSIIVIIIKWYFGWIYWNQKKLNIDVYGYEIKTFKRNRTNLESFIYYHLLTFRYTRMFIKRSVHAVRSKLKQWMVFDLTLRLKLFHTTVYRIY